MRSIGVLVLVAAISSVASAELTLDVKNYDVLLNVESIEEEHLKISGNTKILINLVNTNTITFNARTTILSAELISGNAHVEVKTLTKDESSSRVTLDFGRTFTGLYTLVIKHTSENIPDNQPETSGVVRKVYSSESKKKYNLGKEPNQLMTRSYMLLSRFENGNVDNIFPCFLNNGTNLNGVPFRVSIEHPLEYNVLTNIPKTRTFEMSSTTQQTIFNGTEPMLPRDLVIFVSKLVKKTHENFTLWVEADMMDSSQTKFVVNFIQRALKEIGMKMHKIDLVALPLLPIELSLESDMDSELNNPELYSRLGVAFTNLYLFDNPTTTFIEGRHVDKGDFASCMAKYCSLFDENNFDLPHATTQIKVMRALVNQFIGGHLNNGNSEPQGEFDTLLMLYLSNYYVASMYPHFPQLMITFDMFVSGMEYIREIEQQLPLDVFRAGLLNYYNEYAYKPANRSEFIRSIDQAVRKELNEMSLDNIFENYWSVSFPIINVERNYETGDVHISQLDQFKYFYANGGIQKYVPKEETDEYNRIDREMQRYQLEESDSEWWLPIKVFNPDEDIRSFLLQPSRNLTLNGIAKTNEILIVDSKLPGKYLVNYDVKNWNLIIDALAETLHNHENIWFKIASKVSINKIMKDAQTLSVFGRLKLDEIRKMRLRQILRELEEESPEIKIITKSEICGCDGKPKLPNSDFQTPDLTFEDAYMKRTYLYNIPELSDRNFLAD